MGRARGARRLVGSGRRGSRQPAEAWGTQSGITGAQNTGHHLAPTLGAVHALGWRRWSLPPHPTSSLHPCNMPRLVGAPAPSMTGFLVRELGSQKVEDWLLQDAMFQERWGALQNGPCQHGKASSAPMKPCDCN